MVSLDRSSSYRCKQGEWPGGHFVKVNSCMQDSKHLLPISVVPSESTRRGDDPQAAPARSEAEAQLGQGSRAETQGNSNMAFQEGGDLPANIVNSLREVGKGLKADWDTGFAQMAPTLKGKLDNMFPPVGMGLKGGVRPFYRIRPRALVG